MCHSVFNVVDFSFAVFAYIMHRLRGVDAEFDIPCEWVDGNFGNLDGDFTEMDIGIFKDVKRYLGGRIVEFENTGKSHVIEYYKMNDLWIGSILCHRCEFFVECFEDG